LSTITYTLLGKLPLHAKATQIADDRVQEDCSSNPKYCIADRRCAPLAFNVTCPLCWQTASGHSTCGVPVQSIAYSTPVLRGVLCPPSLTHCQGSFPCTPRLRRSRMTGCKKIAPATLSIASVIFLGPHVGLSTLVRAPLEL
jgi:hypothetical protein